MRKQLTVILVLLNLVVLAVFYLFERGDREDEIVRKNRKIFGEEAVDIDYIRIWHWVLILLLWCICRR